MAPINHLSVVDTAKSTFVIGDFSSLNDSSWSDAFASPKFPSYSFKLGIYPRSIFEHFEEDVFICLWISDKSDLDGLSVQYRVSILDANGGKQCTKEILWTNTNDHNIIIMEARAKLLDPSYGLLPEDKLTIYCEVDILSNKICRIPDVPLQLDCTIQKDFEALLENGKLSDVVLVVGEKKFHAHKNILAARSKVFGAMFGNKETKESMENRVEIIDVDVEAFEELLAYIYTDKFPETDKNVLELFVAADKYELNHLKSICEQTLSTSLTTESVVSTLMVADMHGAVDLKCKCIEYIAEHSDNVRATDDWSQFVKANRFELMHQLFEAMSVKFTGKN